MSVGKKISRRQILFMLSAISASLLLYKKGIGSFLLTKEEFPESFITLFKDLNPELVGAAYIAAYPEESNIDRLMAILTEQLAKFDQASLLEKIQALLKNDFNSDNTFNLRGIALSRNEARLTSLAYLK